MRTSKSTTGRAGADRRGRAPRRRPRKRFGQHFLESVWVAKLVDLIDPRPGDTFLEVGAGSGALTLPLAARAGAVHAVEIDRDLAADLGPRLPANVRLVNADILELDLDALLPDADRLRVAGNLPYNIAAPVLFQLLALGRRRPGLTDATVMVQHEVAERLVAAPGSGAYGVLRILVSRYADVTRLLTLPPGAFRPPPTVTSALVRLSFRPPLVAGTDAPAFEALVRTVFTRRRKTILNALKPLAESRGASAAEALAALGIEPRRRPETLEVTELAALADFLAARGK